LPVFGRDDELTQLDAIYARAVEYQAPQLITVVGTQGTGKTRLCSEWLTRIAAAGDEAARPRVYRAKAQAGSGSNALIARLLRDRFGIAESDGEPERMEKVRAELTEVFADPRMTEVLHFMGRFLDLRIGESAFLQAMGASDDERQMDAIARTVLRRFLELDAARSPLILAFDNLHLGDDDSLTLLGELAEGLGGSPVVLLTAARPELFVRRPSWGEGSVDHTRLELVALERADAEKLLRALLAKAEPLPSALVEYSCELTGGNPFFVEELVRVFLTNGTVTVVGERWRIDPVRATAAELPLTVEDAIEARIAALSPEERDLLEKASTLGNLFWLGALVVLGRLGDDDAEHGFSRDERAAVEAVLAELVERDYLLKMPDSTVPGDVEYAFKHNLEHDLVQKRVAPERARRYHRVAAEWLETKMPSRGEQSGEQLEFQALLYENAGDRGRAAAAYLAAADKARERFANEAAIGLYEKGLALYDRDSAIWRIDPLHNYGDVLHRAGHTQYALSIFREMLLAAWRLDHRAKAGAAHSRIARVHRSLGEYSRAEHHLQKAIELFRSAGDVRGVAAVEDDIGRVAFLRGDFPMALQRHERALELRREIGDQRSIALSLHNLGLVHQASGEHGEAVVRFSEALALRREIGDKPGVVQSLLAVGQAWRDRGEVARAFDVLTEALSLAREIGDRIDQATILTHLGEAEVKLARDSEAAGHLTQAVQLAESYGDRLLESEATRLLAEVHLVLDDPRAALAEARRALALAEKVGSRPQEGMAHRALAEVLARGGLTDEDKAATDEHFAKAIEILGEVGAELELGRTFQSYAHALQGRGDLEAAAGYAERAEEITERLAPRDLRRSRST
jgi:tetratricopeptide (TPR) repeat protein